MSEKFDTFVSVCAEAFRAENEVVERLTSRAEKYIAAIGVILAFHVVELPTLKFTGDMWEVAAALVVISGGVLLGAALVLAIYSMRLRDYATYSDSASLRKLVEPTITDQVAKQSIAVMYLALRDQTLVVNQKRARGIIAAGYLLLAGFVLSIAGQVILRLY